MVGKFAPRPTPLTFPPAPRRPAPPRPPPRKNQQETTQVVLRSVTARAVQRVLARLHSVDRASYDWLSRFAAAHPPIEGSAFVTRLLSEPPPPPPPVASPAAGGGQGGGVNPAQLASAVLVTRAELARDVAALLEDCAARENVGVLQDHLRRHTYVTGNTTSARTKYGRGAAAAEGAAAAAAAAAESVALWRELRRRAPPPPQPEGGDGPAQR